MPLLKPVRRTKPTSGVLYTQICDPDVLSKDLADTIGMKVDPDFVDGLFDKFFLSKGSGTYYSLPDNLSNGMSFVLKTLAKRAVKFQESNGIVPVLFIDGIDILARKRPVDLMNLVGYARFHANCGELRIVLVSSEGHLMPLIDGKASAKIRADVFEVLDLDDEAASKYFADRFLNEEASTKAKSHHVTTEDDMKARAERLAKHINKHVGGRFVFLDKALTHMKDVQRVDPKITEDDLVNEVVRRLVADVVGRRTFCIDTTGRVILRLLCRHNGCLQLKDISKDELTKKAVDKLVGNNLLRYDVSGNLRWHSKLVEDELLKRGYCKEPWFRIY